MSAKEQIAVVAYYQAHKPLVRDLARVFGVKPTSAHQIIQRHKREANFLVF